MDKETSASTHDDRREFLKKCGRFAAVTPPAITMLLSTSLTSDAIAKSSKGKAKGASKGKKIGWLTNGKK